MASPYIDPNRGIESEENDWYRVIQRVGEGGNAVTYLVVQTEGEFKGNLFALKVFKHLSNEERRERFFEAQEFLEQTSHPSILQYRDRGTYYEYPFLVSEYLPKTLDDVMRGGPISTQDKISYAIQLLSGLSYLESRDPPVIHRDIKPSNIFIKGGACVLGDFGLLKRADSGDEGDRKVWRESAEAGVPYFYRSPDLVSYANEDGPLTTKSDVFQLGLVLTELFTGRNPAKRPKDDDPLSPVELEEIGHIPGDLGGGVFSLLDRMLDTDPDTRESAEELMDGWMGLFEESAEMARDLNGRVL